MMETKEQTQHKWWKWELRPDYEWYRLGLRDLYYNRGLIMRFVHRDLFANIKQTVFGPVWLFIQPLMTTILYMLVFNKIARIPTTSVPPLLFYLSGIIIWNYFSDIFSGCVYTFRSNEQIFTKVYFPRLLVPIGIVVTQTIRIGIQLLVFLGIFIYLLVTGQALHINYLILLVPVLLLITAFFAAGLGVLVSIFTVKYRDIDSILGFGLRLFMFATPIFYPLVIVPPRYQMWIWCNPLAPIIRTFRSAFAAHPELPGSHLLAAAIFSVLLAGLGVVLFKKQEIKIMDVI